MTLIIAFILLGHTDAGWGSYAMVAATWFVHLIWHSWD